MNNIILIILEIIVCYTSIIILNKKYKTDGLYVYGIIATFISCIMSLKQIDIFNIAIPSGFAITISLLIVANIITQKKGLEPLKTYIILILVTSLISCCFFNLSGLLNDSDYGIYSNESYNSIFKYNIRIYIANIISIIVSVYLGSRLYYFIRKINNRIIISNMFSIINIELLDSILFILIALLFEVNTTNLILSMIFRYLIKTIIGLFGTIPIYITNKFN